MIVGTTPGVYALALVGDALYAATQDQRTFETCLIGIPHREGAPPSLLWRGRGLTCLKGTSDRLLFQVSGDEPGRIYSLTPPDASVTALQGTVDGMPDVQFAVSGERIIFFGRQSTGKLELRQATLAGQASPIVAIGANTSFAAICADRAHVYWQEGEQIRRAPIQGGAATDVATTAGAAMSLSSDDHHLYFTDTGADWGPEDGSLLRIPVGGGAPEVVADRLDNPHDLITDGHSVYWIEADSVIGCRKNPLGAPRVLSADLPGSSRMVLHGDHLYVACIDDGTIRRIAAR